MKIKLNVVIEYLNGKTDIYNGNYQDVITVWNNVWDEMLYMGYNPESISDIKRYMSEL